jgi:hypothetical protein
VKETLPLPTIMAIVLILKKTGMTQTTGQICIDNMTTDMLTERGPVQIQGNGIDFPKTTDNHHFSGECYAQKNAEWKVHLKKYDNLL